jgi:hypothetical protein
MEQQLMRAMTVVQEFVQGSGDLEASRRRVGDRRAAEAVKSPGAPAPSPTAVGKEAK